MDKEKLRAKWKREREKYKEKRAAYAKLYYARRMAADPTYNDKKCKAYREQHVETIAARRRLMLAHSREVSRIWRQTSEKWRIANNARSKRYTEKNPERSRELKSAATAKRRAAPGKLSRGIVKQLFERQNGKCLACQCELVKYHLDHILALANGGTHTDDNVQLLCRRCNLKKSTKDNAEFMATQAAACLTGLLGGV